jgi:hypothetical protein
MPIPESIKPGFIPEFSKKRDEASVDHLSNEKPTAIFGAILAPYFNEEFRSFFCKRLKRVFHQAVLQRGTEAVARQLFAPVSLKELYQDPQIKRLLSDVGIHPNDASAEERLVDTLLDKRVSDDLFAAILIHRANAMETGYGAETGRLAQEGFNLHKEPLVEDIRWRLSLTDEQQDLLRRRLECITLIQAVDPLEGPFQDATGTYNPIGKVIQISMQLRKPHEMGPVLIHEMIHALSAHLYRNTPVEVTVDSQGDPIKEDSVSAIKTGVEIETSHDRAFRFLNEGITETIVSLYLAHAENDPLRSRWSTDFVGYASDTYQDEMSLILNIHTPEHLVLPTPAQSKQLQQALQRAREAGVLIDEEEFENLLFKAYFLDEYVEGEPGYAQHWRAWSKKMREYYGDGVLVELTKTWAAQVKKHQSTEQALRASSQMLFKRFLKTWGKSETSE